MQAQDQVKEIPTSAWKSQLYCINLQLIPLHWFDVRIRGPTYYKRLALADDLLRQKK